MKDVKSTWNIVSLKDLGEKMDASGIPKGSNEYKNKLRQSRSKFLKANLILI